MSETWPLWAATAFTAAVAVVRRHRNRPPRASWALRRHALQRAVALGVIPGSLLIPLAAAVACVATGYRPGPLVLGAVFAAMVGCLTAGWRWTCALHRDDHRGPLITADEHRAACALEDPWRRGRREHLERQGAGANGRGSGA